MSFLVWSVKKDHNWLLMPPLKLKNRHFLTEIKENLVREKEGGKLKGINVLFIMLDGARNVGEEVVIKRWQEQGREYYVLFAGWHNICARYHLKENTVRCGGVLF